MANRTGEDDGAVQKKKRKTRQRKVKSITASTGKCMLPTIAPELRNKIYELVLLEGREIVIDKKLRVPALLQVCQQLRIDTLTMWYQRNVFHLTIKYCNADLLLRWGRHVDTTLPRNLAKVRMWVDFRGKPNWSNLVEFATSVQHNEDCKLLELSAELRNIIYEFVLLQKDVIVVTPTLRSPALLQVSRQIRTETLAMWYESNTFEITVNDCKADLLHAWCRNQHALGVTPPAVLDITGIPDWGNLARWWCKAICEDDCSALRKDSSDSRLECVIAAATEIAASCNTMSESKETSWAYCEDLLSNLRHVVAKLDPRWLEERDPVEVGDA
ncbi:hypothetical protein LTS10_008971 [Elasticomyces elasticus]|nr:hypothetical protein LTS10_008971 [Elasticomyces elasticus]